jgi:phage terminase large subunit
MSRAAEVIKMYRSNPVEFVKREFGVTPDLWQENALNAFISNDPLKQRISMQACAGPGKSTVMAWIGWLFLLCYAEKGNHPKAAAVSITGDNLRDNLWSEMSKWQDRSELLTAAFTWTQTRIFAKDHPNTWFMSARSFPKSANAEEVGRTLSGLHSKFVLYLIDESGDIPPSIIKSAEQGLSTGPEFGKIVQAGNPTSHSGMLYHTATKLRHNHSYYRRPRRPQPFTAYID